MPGKGGGYELAISDRHDHVMGLRVAVEAMRANRGVLPPACTPVCTYEIVRIEIWTVEGLGSGTQDRKP